MNYRKRGLKALGLAFLAVLGLMAFSAGGAQASGTVLVEGLSAPFTVGISGEAHNALASDSKLLILGLNMEIFCHAASVSNGLLSSSGTGTATITFETCLAQGVSGGALTGAVCELENIVAKTNALVILHSGNPYVQFTPSDGLTFATVINETECALPEEAKVKGCVVAGVERANEDEVTKLITTKNIASLFGCSLSYGANAAHLSVDANVKLSNSVHGNHSGLKWGVA